MDEAEPEDLEIRARRVTELMAVTLQGALPAGIDFDAIIEWAGPAVTQ